MHKVTNRAFSEGAFGRFWNVGDGIQSAVPISVSVGWPRPLNVKAVGSARQRMKRKSQRSAQKLLISKEGLHQTCSVTGLTEKAGE